LKLRACEEKKAERGLGKGERGNLTYTGKTQKIESQVRPESTRQKW